MPIERAKHAGSIEPSLRQALQAAFPTPPATLNAEQRHFLLLHACKLVVKWKWHFGESMLRADTDKGRIATISRDNLDDLLRRGFMRERTECAGVTLTKAGREAVA